MRAHVAVVADEQGCRVKNLHGGLKLIISTAQPTCLPAVYVLATWWLSTDRPLVCSRRVRISAAALRPCEIFVRCESGLAASTCVRVSTRE